MDFANIPPPTYDSVLITDVEGLVKEVERLTQKTKTDQGFKTKIKDAFVIQAGLDDNAKKILDDVDKFTQAISQLNLTFGNVGDRFHEIDQLQLHGPDGKVWRFEDEWHGLRDRWKKLFTQSQHTALKAEARAEELNLFCKGILNIDTAGDQRFKDTLTELEQFIEKPDEEGRKYDPKEVEKQTRTHSKEYGQLKYDLTTFKAKYNLFAEFVGVGVGFEAAVLNAEIAQVEAAIHIDHHLISELGIGLDVTTFTTLAGGVIGRAIGSLSVAGVAMIVLGALSAVGEGSLFVTYLSELEKRGNTHDKLRDDIKANESSMKALDALKSIFENQEKDTGFIITLLDFIRNTWLIINNEANLLYSGLQKVTDPTTLTHFKDQVKHVQVAYSALSVVLARIARVTF